MAGKGKKSLSDPRAIRADLLAQREQLRATLASEADPKVRGELTDRLAGVDAALEIWRVDSPSSRD